MPSTETDSTIRKYGDNPYRVAVLHGGPGAAGGMAPVARELSRKMSVLEPFQTGMTITEQVEELRTALIAHGQAPVTLIGHSWGAWLGYIFATMYAHMVKKLIMIGAGPFSERYVQKMNETRWNRLTREEQQRVESLKDMLAKVSPDEQNRESVKSPVDPGKCGSLRQHFPGYESHGHELVQKTIFADFGRLMSRADAFDPIYKQDTPMEFRPDIFNAVMPEAAALRRSGALLGMGEKINCPVVAIHGDFDPHPSEGVLELSTVLSDFRFILLEHCGHQPWEERYAREAFFQALLKEVVEGYSLQ